MRLNYEKYIGQHISYGWDEDFGTKIIFNSVSICISINGYFIGVSK